MVIAACWGAGVARGMPVTPFLEAHFGGVPEAAVELAEGWGPLEQSLLPQSCGACHPQQLADWSESRHARALGPGVLGQLIADEAGQDSCNSCHAPLREQRPAPGGTPNPAFRADLRATGLSCPACHIRQGVLHGPPRRGPPLVDPTALPHGGFTEQPDFEDSAFCAACHQFRDDQRRVAGVLLEDTWNEWEASPAAAEGRTCQSCHMPDRRHLWRGIHDPAFTEAGLAFALERTGRRTARYVVRSAQIGHRFPTYVTPRATLELRALNADGDEVLRATHVIQRAVSLDLSVQHFDTRLAPGASATVTLAWKRRHDVAAVEGRLHVEPDAFYAGFFEVFRTDDPEADALLAEALQEARDSPYHIGTRRLVGDAIR